MTTHYTGHLSGLRLDENVTLRTRSGGVVTGFVEAMTAATVVLGPKFGKGPRHYLDPTSIETVTIHER